MFRHICSTLLYKRLGWTKLIDQPHPDKYIICLAPHTSNWDFALGQLYARAESLNANFLMKKEWFVWPLGPVFRSWGGIPVCRKKHVRMTDAMVEAARNAGTFHLCITPEGTRKPTADWKRGFYYIALGANIPILLYGIDYRRRLIQCTKTVWPTGDIEKDLHDIKQYFKDFQGRKPENFKIN